MSTLSSTRGAYDPTEKPPPFGHALKKYFALDPDYVNLNNGTPAYSISRALEPNARHRIVRLGPLVGSPCDDRGTDRGRAESR